MNNFLFKVRNSNQSFVINRANMTIADYSSSTKELKIRFIDGTNITMTLEPSEGESLLEAINAKN